MDLDLMIKIAVALWIEAFLVGMICFLFGMQNTDSRLFKVGTWLFFGAIAVLLASALVIIPIVLVTTDWAKG